MAANKNRKEEAIGSLRVVFSGTQRCPGEVLQLASIVDEFYLFFSLEISVLIECRISLVSLTIDFPFFPLSVQFSSFFLFRSTLLRFLFRFLNQNVAPNAGPHLTNTYRFCFAKTMDKLAKKLVDWLNVTFFFIGWGERANQRSINGSIGCAIFGRNPNPIDGSLFRARIL